ncbi:MAG: hypothetical protein MUF05_04275 [Candidatus Omnitrophica bacterium]|jgi:phosphopantothenoylcysteine decarboxylase/phosphopantothenate--cysteine ligase|nr:hypothetical protein [Candidatus Omnitrophota bacterium]
MPKEKKQIILGVTASVAIYKACDLVRRLRENNFGVTVVMTQEAKELIRPALFEAVSFNKVYTEMFNSDRVWEIEHISLAEKADLILIAPATANIIGKLANGICDDLLSCTVIASNAPVLIAAAMNTKMYQNKIVQDNIKKLKTVGYKFIGPVEGNLACGKKGLGCLAGVEEIIKEVKRLL